MSINQELQAISVQNISYYNGSHLVLEGVTFDVHVGEYIGIVGDNGAGKSTLLHIILNIKQGFEGSVEIFGESNIDFKSWDRVGFVPQKHSLTSSPLSVVELIRTGYIKGGDSFENSLNKQAKLLGFEDLLNRNVIDLSGGELQKILIARGMINDPELLILDEPTVAIDPDTRKELLEYISLIHQKSHVTVLHVTHNIEQIKHHVNRILCISKNDINESTFELEHVHSHDIHNSHH